MKKGILVVNQDQFHAEKLEGLLREEGFKVKKLNSHHYVRPVLKMHNYQVVFIDFILYALCDLFFNVKVSTIRPGAKVIITSDNHSSSDEIIVNALRHGVYGFMKQPFRHDEVKKIINDISSCNKGAKNEEECVNSG